MNLSRSMMRVGGPLVRVRRCRRCDKLYLSRFWRRHRSCWVPAEPREFFHEDDGSCAGCTAETIPEAYTPCPHCAAACGHDYCAPCEDAA